MKMLQRFLFLTDHAMKVVPMRNADTEEGILLIDSGPGSTPGIDMDGHERFPGTSLLEYREINQLLRERLRAAYLVE